MVGKPNLPSDADWRTDVKGAADEAPGLTPLDVERQASLADEGGASGAVMEAAERAERYRARPSAARAWGLAALGIAGSLVLLSLLRPRAARSLG